MLASRPMLVGREREQRRLREMLEQGIEGHGSLALVSGEAGIGKTALVEELSRQALEQEALVLAGGCYDLLTTPPYGPWVEILQGYPVDERLPSLPDQLRVGGGMAGIDSQAALFDLAGRILASVAGVRPLLLMLEDLHWSDPASLDLLRYLSRKLSDARVVMLATYRDDEITREHPLSALLPALVREGRVDRLALQRLDREAVQAIVRARYRLANHDDEARLLVYLDSLAEGNPFFIHELLHTLEGQRLLNPVAGGWQLGDLSEAGMPSLIQMVIDGRLARLAPATRDVLDLAAVIGYDASLDLLFDVHTGSPADLDGSLQQAVDHHLLRIDVNQRSARFSHALVRQAIYEEIPYLQRQRLHQRVGDALANRSRPDPSTVAGHLYAAGDKRALDWLVRSAEQAQRLFAPQAVIAECDRAFDLAGQLGVDAPRGLYRLRGLARESLEDFDGAREDHEAVLDRAREQGDRRTEWQALLDLGMLWASRDYQQSREYCEWAVELARTMDDPAALGHSLNRLGNWHANAEQPVNALPYHEEALEIFEALGDVEGKARTLDLFGMSCALQGDMPRASRYFSQAAPILRQLEDYHALQSCLANLPVASWGGWCWRVLRYPEPDLPAIDAKAVLSESLSIARNIGSRAGVAYTATAMGTQAAACGELRMAFEHFQRGLTEAEEIQHHLWVAQSHGSMGQVLVELLLADRARLHLQSSMAIARQTGSTLFEGYAAGLLASALIQQGHYGNAGSLLDQYVDLSAHPAMGSVRQCWFACVELTLAQKQYEDALDIADRLIASIPDGSGLLSPYLTRLRGEILLAAGRVDQAEEQLAKALADATRLGFPLILWRILATQARLYLAQGRTDKAREAGNAASEIVSNLASQLDDEDLRAEFLRNARALIPGMPPYAPGRSTASIYAGLTPRELEVLACLARGYSDREIADELFISPRTVEAHVSNILRKLDVGSRTAAVALAIREGLV